MYLEEKGILHQSHWRKARRPFNRLFELNFNVIISSCYTQFIVPLHVLLQVQPRKLHYRCDNKFN